MNPAVCTQPNARHGSALVPHRFTWWEHLTVQPFLAARQPLQWAREEQCARCVLRNLVSNFPSTASKSSKWSFSCHPLHCPCPLSLEESSCLTPLPVSLSSSKLDSSLVFELISRGSPCHFQACPWLTHLIICQPKWQSQLLCANIKCCPASLASLGLFTSLSLPLQPNIVFSQYVICKPLKAAGCSGFVSEVLHVNATKSLVYKASEECSVSIPVSAGTWEKARKATGCLVACTQLSRLGAVSYSEGVQWLCCLKRKSVSVISSSDTGSKTSYCPVLRKHSPTVQ